MKTLFYKLPRLTILAMLVIIISGFFSVLTLGRQEDPTLTERYGYILTTLPGADAERMEARVTEPLERLLLELPEIQEIKSSSRAGVSQVSITVREDLSPERVDNAWTLIRQQIGVAEAELPDGASKPFIKRVFPGAHTMVVALSWMSDEAPPLAVMSRLSRSLEDRFRNLGATEETEIFGLPSEEVRIIVDTDALAASGLSPRDAARRVAAADVKVPAGDVRARGGDVGIEIGGEFDSISRIRAVPLVQLEDGRALRVGDVAEVRKGIEDPVQQLALTNGRRSIFVAAYIQPNQRVDRWSASARAMVEAFALGVSEDISVDIIFDQNKYTESRLNG
ncbi:MAG: efflux RND transporter permease subunit, partial [Henriciella sp.]